MNSLFATMASAQIPLSVLKEQPQSAASLHETGERQNALSLEALLASSEELANIGILQNGFSAKFQTLDRYLNKVNSFEMEAESSAILHEQFLISLKACIHNYKEVIGNDAAFVVISNRQGSVLFSGWLMALYPGASLFEHQRYNVYLKSCK